MTATEDRVRAAMDAITGLVENVPPLRLPPLPDAAPRSWRSRGVPWPRRRWGSWLAPVAAAAAVLAVAIALVAVRDMPGAPSAPAISPAGAPVSFPDYYVTFSQPRDDTTVPVGLVLVATLTGKKLFTLQAPRGLSFAGVTGAADDRTFVADAHRDPYGVQESTARARYWYLVRVVGTGSRMSLTMTRLPIPPTPVGTEVTGLALSPDGTKLAVATMPWTDYVSKTWQRVQVYSLATGAVLRTWSAPLGQLEFMGVNDGFGGDPNTSLAWIGNRALAFAGSLTTAKTGGGGYAIRELDMSQPGGDILASSHAIAAVPAHAPVTETRPAFGCNPIFRSDVLVTGDGKSFVCGGDGKSPAVLPKLYCLKQPTWNTVGFAAFSLTGKEPTDFLSGYRTGCSGYNVTAYALWVNATGSTVIGYMIFGDKDSGRFGVFSRGSFRPLPYPVPGNSYQYQGGSLLNQVAW